MICAVHVRLWARLVGLCILTCLHRSAQAALSLLGNHTYSPAPAHGDQRQSSLDARTRTYLCGRLTTPRRGDRCSAIPPHGER
jgi:hypothetical protein